MDKLAKSSKKPVKKTGFGLFAFSRRHALQVSGAMKTGDWAELRDLCDADWRALSEREKKAYHEQAKWLNKKAADARAKESEDLDIDPTNPYLFWMEEARIFQEARDIVSNLFEKTPEVWMNQTVAVIYVTTYVEPDHTMVYLPAEIGFSAFTLKEGLIDNYARIVDPSPVPPGHGVEAASRAFQLGLPEIGSVAELSGDTALLNAMKSFLGLHAGVFGGQDFLPVWCLDSDFLTVRRCLEMMFQKNEKHRFPVKILSLSWYAHLASHQRYGKSRDSEVSTFREIGQPLTGSFIYSQKVNTCLQGMFLHETEVDEAIKEVDNFRYFEELCCIYHLKSGKEIQNCALLGANRYVFGVLEILTLSNQVMPIPGGHFPEVEGNSRAEKARRLNMLGKWGLTKWEQKMEHHKTVAEERVAVYGPERHVLPIFRDKFDKSRPGSYYGKPNVRVEKRNGSEVGDRVGNQKPRFQREGNRTGRFSMYQRDFLNSRRRENDGEK